MSNSILNYCETLDLEYPFSLEELNKKYKKKALKYHPDKPNGSKEKFIEIQTAYNELKKMKELGNSYPEIMKKNIGPLNIEEILQIIINEYGFDNIDFLNEMIFFKNIFNEKVEVVFENLKSGLSQKDLDTYIKPNLKKFGIFKKYADDLHSKNCTKRETINISTTLSKALNNKIFRINFENEIFYIPSWQKTTVVESNNIILTVNCNITYDKTIYINEENEIFIKLILNYFDVIDNEFISFKIDNKFEINLDCKKININENHQIIILENIGLPKINTFDIYDYSEKGSIHLNIFIDTQ